MATLWQPVVCGVYDTDHRKLSQGWNTYVLRKIEPSRTLTLDIGFVAFDAIKSVLQDENGKISGPRTVVAGFGAGFTESLLAVTPFESIKTQL